MRAKWFIAGWLGHSAAAYLAERVRAHREWLRFEAQVRSEGKALSRIIEGHRDAKR